MAKPVVQQCKRVLIVAGIILAVLGAIYLVSFTTCSLPNAAAVEAGAEHKPAVALVAKYARREFFKVGDLLLVEMAAETSATTQAVCRIDAIHQPDESQRLRARGRGRRLAQVALDMDFKPTYFVSLKGASSTNSASLRIRESQILGKVIWIFGGKT